MSVCVERIRHQLWGGRVQSAGTRGLKRPVVSRLGGGLGAGKEVGGVWEGEGVWGGGGVRRAPERPEVQTSSPRPPAAAGNHCT